MTFIIGEPCIDVLDKSCMDICPMDCIYTGLRKNYINADECIDCSACADVCPVDAIYPATRAVTEEHRAFAVDSALFFESVLPGRKEPLGSIGGSAKIGDIGTDTPMVAGHPKAAC
ncbi:indolepyruvate ferredoxin oxidoreductase subunit alpha [Nocardia aobensis]|uniref:Ferredoxin n=1 Tax=Nocardia aobensis TaxID=257277 RepID=A0ABW6PFI5_9NOCA